jgi:glycosyltransferase A (GT-A) superfamily protein (DUF2064 family)
MAYTVVTVACGEEDPWGALLHAELERLEDGGWVLCAMTTKTVAVRQQSVGMGTTRYEEQLVLVLHKEGAP